MSARTLLASKSNCGAARASIVFPDFSQTRQAATNKIGGETAVHPCASATPLGARTHFGRNAPSTR